MTIAVGIFDLLTLTIPGALYLTFLTYVAFRLHWVDPGAVGRLPTLLLIVAAVLASYLLGHMGYPLGAWFERLVPSRRRRRPPWEEFVHRTPAAAGRPFVKADPFLLLGAVQFHDTEVALDVTRLRASGLMLRNAAPPLVLGMIAAVVELFAGPHPVLASVAAVAFGCGAVVQVTQYRRLRYWANLRTLELSFWVPDVDSRFS